jgi:LmbE family N-acetylglucosaminyl deacetylase
MLNNYKNIYVLAPHTDDGELGAGATIAKLAELGANIYYFAFSIAETSVPKTLPKNILKTEVINATNKLGIPKKNILLFNYQVRKFNFSRQKILEDLIKHKKKLKPDLVFIPSLNDIHQDHLTIAQEGLRAFKGTTILGYELIWNNLKFNPSLFVELERKYIKKKCESLKEYRSQASKNYMNEDFIFSLAQIRGTQIDVKYAESFEVIRMVL